MTWAKVRSIRASDPARLIKDIAVEHGITSGQCCLILSGTTWKESGYTPRARAWKRTKLTWDIVAEIRRDYQAGVRQVALAAQHGVTPACINIICKNRTWCDPNYVMEPAPRRRKLTQEQVDQVRAHYADERSCAWIAVRYGVSTVTIWAIVKNLTWRAATAA